MKLRILVRIILWSVTILVVVISMQVADIYYYGRGESARKVDAAIVLGAAAWGNNPSPVFRERLNHAIDLYNAGLCSNIIITGGKGYPGEPGESVIGKKYTLKNGVPESAVLIENYSRNTEENIYYANLIASGKDIKSFVIVSDQFHLRRASLIAEQQGLDFTVSATPTSRFNSGAERYNFLARETYNTIMYRIERLMRKIIK